MFQDNPLLAQLKQQLHSQTPRAEGVVKATEKGFGFLEVDAQKSYFIPPPQMKKVMHGDRIIAVIHSEKERESAEPEELVEPFLTRFVGKVQGQNDRLAIVPDHPLLKDAIPCRAEWFAPRHTEPFQCLACHPAAAAPGSVLRFEFH